MYAENGKLSNRQIFRLFVFDLMGIATLLLPPYLSWLCGKSGVFAILIGTGLGICYLCYLDWIMKRMNMDINTYLNHWTTPLVWGIARIFLLVHCVITAGFCGYVFAKLMHHSLVWDSSFVLIFAVILIVAAYGVSGGIENRARVYEILFWFVLIPYVLMMFASVRNFEMAYVEELWSLEGENLSKGIYLVFLFYTPLFFSLFLIGQSTKRYRKNRIKTIAASVWIAGGILLGSYILLLGNFGEESLASMEYPVITLMSTIQFKGNFLKRMDSLMLAVWFFTLYALLNLHLHYASNMMCEIFSKGKKRNWQVIATAVFVFFVGSGMHFNADLVLEFVYYYAYIGVPILILGPFVLLLCRKKEGGVKNETQMETKHN